MTKLGISDAGFKRLVKIAQSRDTDYQDRIGETLGDMLSKIPSLREDMVSLFSQLHFVQYDPRDDANECWDLLYDLEKVIKDLDMQISLTTSAIGKV